MYNYHNYLSYEDLNCDDSHIKDPNYVSLSIPIINQLDEEDDENIINFDNYNEKIDSFNLNGTPIEERINIPKENFKEDLFVSNGELSLDEKENNDSTGKKHYLDNVQISFKKNRNNLNNNYFKITKDKIENNNNNCTSETSSSNHNSKIIYSKNRSDSLLIKFKSFLGKSFIKHINYKLSNMSKRKIKFFSFNYKKFTLNVTYNQNKIWLNEKVKDLLIFGDEPNQIKNEKSLKSLYNKKHEVFNEIKNLLELTYKEIIERFYLSKYFEEFKKDKDILLLNENFQKVKNISILEKNGFINFIYKEKGNIKKSD